MRIMSMLAALMIGARESSRSEFHSSRRGAPPVIDELPQPLREMASRRYYAAPESYPNGPGWTCAHVKRTALKARNRARHKAAVRRAPR